MTQARHRSLTPRIILIFFALAASPALAIPYLISYEANTPGSFPEDEGWRRSTGGSPGATRTVQAGILTLASDDIAVTDSYHWGRPENLDPEAGEVFFIEWRVVVSALSNEDFWDAGVTVASNAGTVLGIRHALDRVVETNSFNSFSVTPGVFHTYRLESEDMLTFNLSVDGEFAMNGEFRDSLNQDFIAFGDAVGGVASTSSWDYVRFGVVPIPEASSGIGMGFLGLALTLGCGRRRGALSAEGFSCKESKR